MVAFRKPKSLRQYLVKAKAKNNAESVNVSTEVPGCYKLHNSRCSLCHVLRESDHFTSNLTKRTNRIKDHIDCKSKGVIYLATCENCGKQYVGETGTAFSTRHYGHRINLTKKPLLPLAKHFNRGNCAFENISIIGTEISKGDTKARKRKEGWWQHHLKTSQQLGTNNRDEFVRI